MAYSVLIVDDENLTLCTISRGLSAEGFEVLTAASGEEALQIFEDEKPDLVLLDIVLPGIDGVEVLRQIKAANPACIVVMMSAYHMVDRAVDAMKLGAYDYLIKPFHLTDLTATLRRASEMLSLRVRVRDTVETAKGQYDFGRVVTQNPAMRQMLEVARKPAESDHTTILIQGESGTGKGVLARAIHYSSPRANQPLLELNCATLPDALLESELFGFEPVAFTDARRRKEGLLERAHSGTLFLDEIGNMSLQRADQTFARAGGGNFSAARGHEADQSRRAPGDGDQHEPEGGRRPGTISRGSLLSTQCRAALYSPAAREKGRHPAPGARHGAKV